MPSIRAQLFLTLLRNRHLLRLKRHPETGADWEHDLPGVRARAEKAAAMLSKPPKDLFLQRVDIHGNPAEWLTPRSDSNSLFPSVGNDPAGRDASTSPAAGPDPAALLKTGVMLYFRGGGYVLGAIEPHRGIVAKFIRKSGVPALLFEYRNAPENPYPAALDDALAAYVHLLETGVDPQYNVFVGDSAGGGLLLATLLHLKDHQHPLPAAAVALSPFTDLQCTGESLKRNAATCISPLGSWLVCSRHYAAGHDRTMPYISPLYGDLEGLPPLFLSAGSHEALLDDSVRFAHKAALSGVDVTLSVGQGMCHCYPACAPLFPEATKALEEICGFIATHARKQEPATSS